MSSTEAPPFAVVICHGSYHTPAPYQLFVSTLKAQGIEAYCPQLPSSDLRKMNVGDISKPDYDREPPVGGYPQPNDDAIVLNQLLSELITKSGKNVILVGHSAGAFTATMVAVPEFQARIRNERGEKGGIIGIFYECGFLIPVGESTHSFFQPKDGSEAVTPPYCQFHKHGFAGVASTKDGANYFFNGLDDATAKHYEATLTASANPTTVLTNDAYTALPCAYLVTENDKALPPAYQNGMVAMQNQRPGVDMTVYRCPSGHSPHLTWTEGLVEAVSDFERKIAER